MKTLIELSALYSEQTAIVVVVTLLAIMLMHQWRRIYVVIKNHKHMTSANGVLEFKEAELARVHKEFSELSIITLIVLIILAIFTGAAFYVFGALVFLAIAILSDAKFKKTMTDMELELTRYEADYHKDKSRQ